MSQRNLDAARRSIRAQKFADETAAMEAIVGAAPYRAAVASRITADAVKLVTAARESGGARSMLDTFLTEYGLSNSEGVALMCLAESLLRVPDPITANRLIADKISVADWAPHLGEADSLLVNASTWALMLTGRLVTVDREFTSNPSLWLRQLTNRLSEPVVQAAVRSAMQVLGREFVLGQTIEKAFGRARPDARYSFDMLGEAARTQTAAERYFEAYAHAIAALDKATSPGAQAASSISIKLSALHPRYEAGKVRRVARELIPTVKKLCLMAQRVGLDLTIDAEEADRLDLSLDVFEAIATDGQFRHWNGLGMVVQAYSRRARPVIAWLGALAAATGRRIPVRLVKGAYWDAEIKHAQVMGHPSFPVYTRKSFTDCSYLCCAQDLMDQPAYFLPQFATHNAQTVAAIMAMCKPDHDIEFQRLHGMGGALYDAARQHYPDLPPVRIYAPVGGYQDLLAYLVRRLLENGANSSFVNRFLDVRLPPEDIVRDPFYTVRASNLAPHPNVLQPNKIFAEERSNSEGLDLTDTSIAASVERACSAVPVPHWRAASLVGGQAVGGNHRSAIVNPANINQQVGDWLAFSPRALGRAFSLAKRDQFSWSEAGGGARARLLNAAADQLEKNRTTFIALLCSEAGKTIPDALAEVREAVDFCRYYAKQGERLFDTPSPLPGPTGEANHLSLVGRGVFVCISPWNFPLAIFLGQIAAALAAGNAVIAKPAEETPLVAYEVIRLLHRVGVPSTVCQLVTGDRTLGAALVQNPGTDGVAFTGSTEAARAINLALASRPGPILPLIAETGGQNAMIVDSTALLEQVVDDVIDSAFGGAGQRCSALRVLFVQDDIADAAIEMIGGAMDELQVGSPARMDTDIGPVISRRAADALESHIREMSARAKSVHRTRLSPETQSGYFVAPTLLEIGDIGALDREIFGPVLHLVRFKQQDLGRVLQDIGATGYGLTLGIHSRIESRVHRLAAKAPVGNVYINRNMIGAVVGSQPFGGQGLSGTGPKAGGPNYLPRFGVEKVVTINTVATGGNAELLSLNEL